MVRILSGMVSALIRFLLVVALPVLLLVVLALVVATLVFTVLWLANKVLELLRPVLPRRDGRENVRVIRRPDGH